MNQPNGAPRFHDPTIIPWQGRYLCFSTDLSLEGVQVSQSTDLMRWALFNSALLKTPESVLKHTGATRFWAPEVVLRGDEWRLYCCASQFGKTQSVIGLAVSAAPDKPFTYRGDVMQSVHDGRLDTPNAIDACAVMAPDGQDYLIYGSFFGGIRIAPLNADGFLREDGPGKLVAGGGHQAVEGAYCFYHAQSGRFVLLTSWGSLSHNYQIRVAYSNDIMGPYLDSRGRDMTLNDPAYSTGDKLVNGYNFDVPGFGGVMAPGHCSVMPLGDERMLVHHARPEGDEKHPFMQIRRLFLTGEGYALAWPLTYDGAPVMPAQMLPKQMKLIRLEGENNAVVYGRPVSTADHGFELSGLYASMTVYGKRYEGIAGTQNGIFACTLRAQDGEGIWGIGI